MAPLRSSNVSPPELVSAIGIIGFTPEIENRPIGELVPIPTFPFTMRLLPNVAAPLELIASAAVVEVASAVDVAKYRLLLIERRVHALLAGLESTRASCGPVEDATVSAQNGVVVPMPTRLPVL